MAKENLVLVYKTGVNGLRIPADVEQSHPWQVDGNFSPPAFMEFAFVCMHGGSEEFRVRGKSKEDILEFLALNKFTTHPRLRHLTITGPQFSQTIKRGESLTPA